MGFDDNGDPMAERTEEAVATEDDRMDFEETTEEFVRNLEEKSASSLQKKAERSAHTSTSTSSKSTRASAVTGMKRTEEEKEEEEEILGTKTRNWRKIDLSFAVELDGQDGEDIKAPDQNEEDNNKIKHHPIMSKIAKFMLAVEKKWNTVKIMSSKKKMVLDSKAWVDGWSINEVKTLFAYSIAKNRNRNVQVILYIYYGQTATLWKMKNKVFDTLKVEGLWISNHNGPPEIVETTQIRFFVGVHPELYMKGWEDNINRRIKEYYDSNSGEMIMQAHKIPELKGFLGTLPDIQIMPLNIPGMKRAQGKKQKVFAMGVSVPSKFRSLLKYILHAISEDMGIEYIDFAMKYDLQKKILYNKLAGLHQEFMHNHKTINIHCMEREEMDICVQ
jgi:hypothetical protein